MPSPFPGMDPFLETPELWRDVHHGLISQIRGTLNSALRPHYVARVALRVYVSDEDDPGREAIIPDVRVESAPRRRTPGVPRTEPPWAWRSHSSCRCSWMMKSRKPTSKSVTASLRPW